MLRCSLCCYSFTNQAKNLWSRMRHHESYHYVTLKDDRKIEWIKESN